MMDDSNLQRTSCAKWRTVKSEILFKNETNPDWDDHLNKCNICSSEKERLLKSVEKVEDLIPRFTVDKKLQEMFESELSLLWNQHRKFKKSEKEKERINWDLVSKSFFENGSQLFKNLFLDPKMYRFYIVWVIAILAYRHLSL